MKSRKQNSKFCNKKNKQHKFFYWPKKILAGFLFSALFFSFYNVPLTQAATLSLSPSTGRFTVGSTFEVSVYLNTEEQAVNALEVGIVFPPDLLQLVSPSTGKSVIGVWTAQPSVNNQEGKITFQGGIPGGIKVSSGLVTTLAFRVKAVGRAIVRFSDSTRTLLHDGKGTNVLSNTTSGIYDLVLSPPQGPVVTSDTHPDQTLWYKSRNISFAWAADPDVESYSYILNSDPTDVPDDTADSEKTFVTYRAVENGQNYFHIKAFRNGNWGGVTHFAVKVDALAPAEFPIKIIPDSRTTRTQPIIEFSTTDADSGIDHYEIKIVSLSPDSPDKKNLYVETSSPYIPSELSLGKYGVMVRAYDRAGNIREMYQDMSIVAGFLGMFTQNGVHLTDRVFVPWKWFWPPVVILLTNLVYVAFRLRKWHKSTEEKRRVKSLPENLKNQLDELKRYKQKFGSLLLFVLVFSPIFLFSGTQASAEGLNTPIVTVFSSKISNEEIFYIGGVTDIPETEVVVYIQNKQTGENFSQTIVSDKKGEWFYRGDKLYSPGAYGVWVQGKLLGQQSAPGAEHLLNVNKTALQIGSSRLSLEFLYGILVLVLLVLLLGVIAYSIYHYVQGKKKHRLLLEEIRKTEESIKRGFAVLRRDAQAEWEGLAKKVKLSVQERSRKNQLLEDLKNIESKLEKEVWEMENF